MCVNCDIGNVIFKQNLKLTASQQGTVCPSLTVQWILGRLVNHIKTPISSIWYLFIYLIEYWCRTSVSTSTTWSDFWLIIIVYILYCLPICDLHITAQTVTFFRYSHLQSRWCFFYYYILDILLFKVWHMFLSCHWYRPQHENTNKALEK